MYRLNSPQINKILRKSVKFSVFFFKLKFAVFFPQCEVDYDFDGKFPPEVLANLAAYMPSAAAAADTSESTWQVSRIINLSAFFGQLRGDRLDFLGVFVFLC